MGGTILAIALSAALGGAAPDEGKPVEYEVLARNSYRDTLEFAALDRFPDMALDARLQAPGVDTPERLVLKDGEAWSRFWKRANPELALRAAGLAIDFSRDVVLVSAAGAKRGSANVSAIVDVLELAGEIQVVIEESEGACPGPAESSHPLAIVRAPASSKPIRFDVRSIPCAVE